MPNTGLGRRSPPHDVNAPKQTVSLTINSDLYAQAKRLGINASQVAEEALAKEVARRKTEQLKAEILQDIEAMNAYQAKHGSFAEMVREHYASREDGEE
ncbi:MAG TPA: type II toxin-antitoxin system CcdA family antitoxin [Kofleriaceae bacterium]